MENLETEMLTRLESRIDAQDERIRSLSYQIRDLSTSVHTMKEKILNDLPKSLEKMLREHNVIGCNYFDESVFSLTKSFEKTMNLSYYEPLETHPNPEKEHRSRIEEKTSDSKLLIQNLRKSEAPSTLISDQTEESINMFLPGLKNDIPDHVRTLNPHVCDRASVHRGKKGNIESNYVQSGTYIGSSDTKEYNEAQSWKTSPCRDGPKSKRFVHFYYEVLLFNRPKNQLGPTDQSLELKDRLRKRKEVGFFLSLPREDDSMVSKRKEATSNQFEGSKKKKKKQGSIPHVACSWAYFSCGFIKEYTTLHLETSGLKVATTIALNAWKVKSLQEKEKYTKSAHKLWDDYLSSAPPHERETRETSLEFKKFDYRVMQPNMSINQSNPTSQSLDFDD